MVRQIFRENYKNEHTYKKRKKKHKAVLQNNKRKNISKQHLTWKTLIILGTVP